MRNLIKTLVVMLMLSFSHAAIADEWDTFYDKYNGKVFVVSWQKKRNPDGTTIKPIYKETGFSMISPDTVRTIGRDTLVDSGQVLNTYDYKTKKNSRVNNSVGYTTIEIKKDYLEGNDFSYDDIIRRRFIIKINGNKCTAKLLWVFNLKPSEYTDQLGDYKCTIVNN
jgi:hypothetical protein